jgi:glycosyltransferase involved in cell wall biosynthesis
VGELDEQAMVEELQSASIYALPSSIENSPNSLGEAMLQGTPCVAANVGGVSSLAQHGVEALLYQYDDVVMLASSILQLLDDPQLAGSISRNGRLRAQKTHNQDANCQQLVNIYGTIIRNN